MDNPISPERNPVLEAVTAPEAAATAAAKFLGGGDERAAEQAAMAAIHQTIEKFDVDRTIRVCEVCSFDGGLYWGLQVRTRDEGEADLAGVAAEGRGIGAREGYNALSVLAMAEEGGFVTVPDNYMNKIPEDPAINSRAFDLDRSSSENLSCGPECKGISVSDLQICLLDRSRHSQLIDAIRKPGAGTQLLMDGDVNGAVAQGLINSSVDVHVRIGGAPQSVLAAAAL